MAVANLAELIKKARRPGAWNPVWTGVQKCAVLLGSAGGLGLSPWVPATVASAFAAAAGYGLLAAAGRTGVALAIAVTVLVAVPLGGYCERLSQQHDPRFFVLDEVAGQLLAQVFLPPRLGPILLSFVLFRVFDVLKPPPIARLERIPGGWGITLDDLLAGLYAAGVSYICLLLWTQLH